MAYATNAQFIQRSGIGIRIVDENVGTGDNSETDFDLDHGNVIAGTYTLSYAASGSNNFTALTETTHYTLDKESGRILLTASGVTTLGTNVLYATYWYSDIFSDDTVTALLASAEAQVDHITHRIWGTVSSYTDYIDGKRTSTYPTTDLPYMTDYDAPDKIMLDNYPVTKVSQIYFLQQVQDISKFYNYDDTGASYTDKTTAVNSSTEAPFTLFASTPAASDAVYIGSSSVFLGLDVNLSTNGTGSPAIDWEYWNGSAWTDLTETDTDTGASTFTASGKFTWTYPYGWAKTAVNSQTYYWIRGVVSTGYTIAPIVATMTIKDSVAQVLEPRSYDFKSHGEVILLANRMWDGQKNIRVDYSAGQTSTPAYITELTIYVAAVNAYVNLSGGSYDDATSYTIGSKSVTIGEVYVNIREVITQFKARIAEILEMTGTHTKVRGL